MLYLIILIFASANIGTLYLLIQMRRDKQNVNVGNIQHNIDMTEVIAWLDEHYTPKRSADGNWLLVYQDLKHFAHETEQALANIQKALHEEGKLTRKETQELKTALRDDEKDDQRAKAQARRKK